MSYGAGVVTEKTMHIWDEEFGVASEKESIPCSGNDTLSDPREFKLYQSASDVRM